MKKFFLVKEVTYTLVEAESEGEALDKFQGRMLQVQGDSMCTAEIEAEDIHGAFKQYADKIRVHQ